jgi:hypothetical protein
MTTLDLFLEAADEALADLPCDLLDLGARKSPSFA